MYHHTNVLQQLNCRKHEVSGDENCLYYAVAHQAGFIERFFGGNIGNANQLRILALITMQQHPGVHAEDRLSQHQWEQKKSIIFQPTEWVVICNYVYLLLQLKEKYLSSLEQEICLHKHGGFYASLHQLR